MSEEKQFDHIKVEKVKEGNYAVILLNRLDKSMYSAGVDACS